MKNLSLQWLFQFQHIIETGSYTRAANQLKISQQALSKNISSLESWAGQTLIKRHEGRLELTLAGKLLRDALPELFKNLQRINQSAQSESHQFQLVIDPFFDGFFLANALSKIMRAYSETHIRVLVMSHHSIHTYLASDQINVALIMGTPPEHYQSVRLPAIPWVLAASPDYLSQGAPFDYLYYSNSFTHDVFQDISLLPQPTRPFAQSNSWSVIKEFLINGFGACFILEPYIREELKQGSLVCLETKSLPTLPTAAIWSSDTRPPDLFFELISLLHESMST